MSHDRIHPETRLLDRFYGVYAAAVGVILVIGVPWVFERKLVSAVLCLLTLVVVGVAWLMGRCGQPRRSIQFFATVIWLLLFALSVLGLSPATSSTALATAVMLTIVAGRRSGVVFVMAYLLGWLAIILLRHQIWWPDAYFIERPLVTWVIGSISVWLVLLPIPDMVRRIRTSNAYHRRLIEANLDPLFMVDGHGEIVDCNSAACDVLGQGKDRVLGTDFTTLFADGSQVRKTCAPAFAGTSVHDVEASLIHADGSRTPALCHVFPLADEAGQLQGVVIVARDLSERKRMEAELRELATTDFLTGLHTRRHFLGRLDAEFERVRRHPTMAACVLMLDLDHFKRVNDALGHAAGDAVLRRLASVLRDGARKSDLVGRLGGEEFGMLLSNTDISSALVLAHRIQERLAQRQSDQPGYQVTVSIGVAALSPEDASSDAVLTRADRALYTAKAAGRNRVVLATQTSGPHVVETLQVQQTWSVQAS